MSGFLDKYLSKDEQKKISEFSRRAKKELNSLPVISAIGDTVQGASGLSELQQQIKQNPTSPKYWLFYYEANIIHKKLNTGVNAGRVIINPIGFIAGKGIATGLNTLDDEYEKFNPKHCLGMTIALSMKKIEDKNSKMTVEDLAVLSKAIAYSAETVVDSMQKEKMLKKSIQYISLAIKAEQTPEKQGEYFYYLSQFYQFAQNEKESLRALNISRKIGFKPAEKLMKSRLKSKMSDANERSLIDQYNSHTPYKDFTLTYNPKLEARVDNTWEFVKEQQLQKFSETGKRLSNFFEKVF